MTDYPRFEQVKGDRDGAHEAYHGGPLVTLIFRIVDAWLGYSPKGHEARQPARVAEIEIHERPSAPALSRTQPNPAPSVRKSVPDEIFSDTFLLGSAKTMKLQAGLLAAIAALLVLLVGQGLTLPERPRDQTAHNGAHLPKTAIKKVRDDDGPVGNVILTSGLDQFDR